MRISDWSSDVCSSDLPEGFRLKVLSFFGTTKKGYVYKFGCRIEAIEAQQIFVSNPLALAKAEAVTESEEDAPDADETAVRLIQAMASQEIVPGYRMRRSALVPVQAGDLTVQLVAEYEGLDRSEEHTSELQSLMRISYAVLCLKKK